MTTMSPEATITRDIGVSRLAQFPPGFSRLNHSCKILVFQTLEDASTANPPRTEASFKRVVEAYLTLADVVDKAKHGELSDTDLSALEEAIAAVGGTIAPGIYAQGENSLAAFRAATFGRLGRYYSAGVVDAACRALNAHLKSLEDHDPGHIFQAIADFFAPLIPSSASLSGLQIFFRLDPRRQVLVFETIRAGINAGPSRNLASFQRVVAAYQAERAVLQAAARGTLVAEHLVELQDAIETAGGTLAPAIHATGPGSVAATRAATFKAAQSMRSPEVHQAALAALNAYLRELGAYELHPLLEGIERFFYPLFSIDDRECQESWRSLDAHHQLLVFNSVEIALAREPELKDSIVGRVVMAFACMQKLLAAAAEGSLTRELVDDLHQAITLCGGVIAPNLHAEGQGSVGEFRETCFAELERSLPFDAYQAAIDALNTKLRASDPRNLDDVIASCKDFVPPIPPKPSTQTLVVVPGSGPSPAKKKRSARKRSRSSQPDHSPHVLSEAPKRQIASSSLEASVLLPQIEPNDTVEAELTESITPPPSSKGVLQNPVFWVLATNAVFWGLPFALFHVQETFVVDRKQTVSEQSWDSQARSLSPSDPLWAFNQLALQSSLPLTGANNGVTSLSWPNPLDDSPRSSAPPLLTERLAESPSISSLYPTLNPLQQLQGADGLGGLISLASLDEPLMPIAARAEMLQWQRSNDELAALPLHWRNSLRQELPPGVSVSQVATVRLHVLDVPERQELPLIIDDQGVAESLVMPRHPRIREAVESWAARQKPADPGTVQVLLLAAEPLASERR